jgi:protein-L-isoaspartate(D-aspartate) O-methyltransferase
MDLIDSLISQEYLKTPRIIDAFRAVKREDFVLEEMKYQADLDAPLPIGWGQTISQPLTVAFMLELLQPERGDRILDVGAGSGWVSALLAYLVSGGDVKSQITSNKSQTNSKPQIPNSKHENAEGKVYAAEVVPQLCEFGRENREKYKFIEKGFVEHFCADATKGFPQYAPFDKIHAAAAGEEIPYAWKDQLKIGGRIVAPVKSSVWLFIKKSKSEWEEKEYPGFAFVPLIKH